jgi:hypothetical protein
MRLNLTIVLLAAAALAQEPANPLDAPKAKGQDAGITIFPVLLAGRLFPQASEVVGIFLERGGMRNLELSSAEFRRAEGATMEQAAAQFGEFVRRNPIRTEYALYAEFLGAPATGISEVRGILVDKRGNTVWSDRQTPQDAAFKEQKPRDPMECAVLLVRRLRETLGLQDPFRPDAPEGKLAKSQAERTGLPTQTEQAAMKQARETARTKFAGAKVTVFPILIAGGTDRTQATRLGQLLSQEKLGKVEAAAAGPALELRPGPNEQQRLWDTARGFREHLRRTPPAADYAIYAEYGIDRERGGAFFVHFVVCDPSGEWVIVDFQNEHHKDFQSVAPKSADDCDRLVAKRLAGYLR